MQERTATIFPEYVTMQIEVFGQSIVTVANMSGVVKIFDTATAYIDEERK
jgi:hypothetical protein